MSTKRRARATPSRTRIDLPEAVRGRSIALLNQHLADVNDLYSQTKQAHWNVRGSDFIQLHELFDLLAEETLPFADMIAERVTALGGVAQGTARMAAASSRLPEYPEEVVDGPEHVEALAARFAAVAAAVRSAIDATGGDDAGTSDLFTEISRAMDKHLWFLDAHLSAR